MQLYNYHTDSCFTVWSDEMKGILSPLYYISAPKDTSGLVFLKDAAVVNPSRKTHKVNDTEIVPYVGLPETDDKKVRMVLHRPYKEVAGRNIIKIGDILFARIEPSVFNKKYIYVDNLDGADHAYTSTEFYIIQAKDEVNPHYLFSILFSDTVFKQIIGKTTGSTGRRRLDRSAFENILIPLPPRKKQDKIAALYLKSEQQKNKLEAQAKLLLHSLSDYVLTKLQTELPEKTDDFIYSAWTDEIDYRVDPFYFHPNRQNAIKALRNSKHKLLSLKQVVRFKRDIVDKIDGTLPYLGLENIVSNTEEYEETTDKTSISSAFRFDTNNVLFPKLRPYLNKVYCAEFPGLCSTEFHVLEPKECDPYYLYAFLSSDIVVRQTSYLMTGNTLPRLQTEDVEKLLIPIPSIGIQREIASEVRSKKTQAKALLLEAKKSTEDTSKEIERMMLGEIYGKNN